MKLLLLLLCSSLACAFPNRNSTSIKRRPGGRIIGGVEARSGQFPFSVAIYTITHDGNYFCGGTLVTDRWVLTAGQCVDGVTLFSITLGTNDLDDENPYTVKVSADTYVLHPEYNPLNLNNDIGLIWLREPVQFSDYLKPVDFLPFAELPDESSAMAIGWGQTSDNNPGLADNLQYVYVTSLATIDCLLVYGNQITDSMGCAEGNFNQGTCIGDTGSPLIQTISRGHSVIAGISSFVSINGCETTDPSGFTKVYKFNDWIRATTGMA